MDTPPPVLCPSVYSFRRDHSSRNAFTLIELLVVVTIILTLLGFGTMAVSELMRSYRMRRTVGSITKMLEIAKETAVTRQTYVWVGIKETAPVLIGASASLNGEPTTAVTNLRPVLPSLKLPRADLKSIEVVSTPIIAASDTSSIDLAIDSTISKSTSSLTFTPQGQVVMAKVMDAVTPTVENVLIRIEFPWGERVDVRIQGNSGNITENW